MGFSLSILPFIAVEDRRTLAQVRDRLEDDFKTIQDLSFEIPLPDEPPFEAQVCRLVESNKEIPVLEHVEVGWSWWDEMVAQMVADLGQDQTEAVQHMKAWRGCAVPFDTEAFLLGSSEFAPREPEHSPEIEKQLDEMVKDRTGGSNQFRVGSGTRILAELEAVCGAWGLPNDEAQARVLAMQKYEELVEDGPVHQCYALICRSFFRVAIEHRLIVWFTK